MGCVLWSIWYERNTIKFNNGSLDVEHLFYTLKIRVGIWAKELLGLDILASNAIAYGGLDPNIVS